jgi:ferritin-like metal-binding protein YciE
MVKSKSRSGSKKHSMEAPDLMAMELREIYSAENQLVRMLPRMAKMVESDELRECLEKRLEQGERLIGDIDDIFEEIDESPGRQKNVAAEGLISDAREHLQEIEAGPALDAVAVAAIQKTEHYCIAAWGTAKALGQALDHQKVVECMDRALNEGRQLDTELTKLAEEELTPALISMGGGEFEEEDEAEAGTRRSTKSSNGRSERRSSARH